VFFCLNISVNYNLLINRVLLIAILMFAVNVEAVEITTLRQSVAYAVQHNRLLAADGSAIEQALAGQDMANGQFMPRIDLSTGVTRTDAPSSYFGTRLNQQKISAADFNPAFLNNPGYINNYQTRLNVNMPLYQGGALWAGKRQAEHQSQSAIMSHVSMQQQVIFQTIQAYARSRQAQASVNAMKSAVSAAEKRYRDTQALQERGILIDSDVMDAHVHLLRSRLQLKQAENALAGAMEQLQRVLGVDDANILHVEGEVELADIPGSLDELVQHALAQRPDLRALEAASRASQAEVDQKRAAFLPQINLVAGQEWNASTLSLKNRNTIIGATVSMNLFAGGSDKARIRASREKAIVMELKIADQKQQIRNEVAHAWRQLDESRVRHASEQQALKQSEESLRIKSLRYEQGLAKTSDLLDAQSQVDQTRLSSIRAGYDVTIAQAALFLACGSLQEGVVQ